MSVTHISNAALSGFASADVYDIHRPSYPPEAVEKFLRHLEIKGEKGARICDLAAGTGKFTEILAAQPEEFRVLAVEPHEGMRVRLGQKALPRVEVFDGTAESMPALADGSVRAVVAAQAFHWFSNMKTLHEVYRVLQPTGVFGMIWNVEDYNAPKSWGIHLGWETTMRDLTWTFDDDTPRFRHQKWKTVFDEQAKSDPLRLHFADPLFGLPIGEDSVPFETWLSKEDIWSRYRTLSRIAILEGDELERTRMVFWEAINSDETETDDQGRVAIHGQTFFAWAIRIPGQPLKSGG